MKQTFNRKKSSALMTRLTMTAMLTTVLLFGATACNTQANNIDGSSVDPTGVDDPSMMMETDTNDDNQAETILN